MIEIVIPVHNRRAITLRCLELLAQQVQAKFTITVVDDGSSDGTSEAIRDRFPDVDVLRGDGSLWWSGATNLGVQHALSRSKPADYIFFLNDDVEFDSDYLACMERSAKAHPGHLIGSLSVHKEDPARVFWCGQAASHRQCHFGYVRRDSLAGCVPAEALPGRGMLVPREVFDRVGLLDAKAFPQYKADLDLSLRARKAGFGLLCCCDTVIMVMVSQTGPGSIYRKDRFSVFLRSFWDPRSPNYLPPQWRFCMKHYGVQGPWQFTKGTGKKVAREILRQTGLISFLLQKGLTPQKAPYTDR
jgi:GT2 family glycosyltransferase